MIHVTDRLSIGDSELELTFIRSSGPGGQNVNKVATAVQLRFDARRSPSLPADVRERLLRLAGARATKAGVIVITARRHRTQEKNREDAVVRLVELIRAAARPPKKRRRTKTPRSAHERRLEEKRRLSRAKGARRPVRDADG